MKVFPDSNTLFLLPPTMADLESRLRARGTETEETLNLRMQNANGEIKRALQKNDPQCLIGYRLINKDLRKSKRLFVQIVQALYQNQLPVGTGIASPEPMTDNYEADEDSQFIRNMDLTSMIRRAEGLQQKPGDLEKNNMFIEGDYDHEQEPTNRFRSNSKQAAYNSKEPKTKPIQSYKTFKEDDWVVLQKERMQ